MTQRSIVLTAAALAIVGVLLVALGGWGGSSGPNPTDAPTPSATASPEGTAPPAPSGSAALFPEPPADPTTSCELFRAIVGSRLDLQRFGELLLGGADRKLAAAAAIAYAEAADDWDELALPLVSKYPGTLDSSSAGYAVEAIKYGATVPQAVDYLAKVINGELTDQTLEEAAAAFADESSYTTLSPMLGFEEDHCGIN